MSHSKINLLNLTPAALAELVASLGEPAYRAKQLIQWIHQKGVADFSLMTNLNKKFQENLAEKAEIILPKILIDRTAADGTRKWLLELSGGNAIEMVFIPESSRGTLCVSSQVGCALNCSFCATGKEGFNRNLSLGEIIGQVWIAVRTLAASHPDRKRMVTNVVMMGMGEPLLNYEAVVPAMDLMMDDLAYGLSKYRVTLSTAGVVPKIEQLSKESMCSLAVSLHAPNDTLRNELVPLNKKYPLEVLMDACRNFFADQPRREITFEYVMLKGINDQTEHARQLIALLKDFPCKVNLIPFNPFPKTQYERSPWVVIEQFQNYLTKHGINTWVRKTRGDEIDAACGQLAGQIQDRTGRHERWKRTGKIVPQQSASE